LEGWRGRERERERERERGGGTQKRAQPWICLSFSSVLNDPANAQAQRIPPLQIADVYLLAIIYGEDSERPSRAKQGQAEWCQNENRRERFLLFSGKDKGEEGRSVCMNVCE
jgi:hypothetical protein